MRASTATDVSALSSKKLSEDPHVVIELTNCNNDSPRLYSRSLESLHDTSTHLAGLWRRNDSPCAVSHDGLALPSVRATVRSADLGHSVRRLAHGLCAALATRADETDVFVPSSRTASLSPSFHILLLDTCLLPLLAHPVHFLSSAGGPVSLSTYSTSRFDLFTFINHDNASILPTRPCDYRRHSHQDT